MLKLLFPRWRKSSTHLKNVTWLIAACIAVIVALFFQAQGPEAMSFISVITYFTLNTVFKIVLNRAFADTLTGALRGNYKAFDHQLRTIFKNHSIFFERSVESDDDGDKYVYDLLAYGIDVTVRPNVASLRFNYNEDLAEPTSTKIVFHKLSSNNEMIVKTLTDAIDVLIDQQIAERKAAKRKSAQ